LQTTFVLQVFEIRGGDISARESPKNRRKTGFFSVFCDQILFFSKALAIFSVFQLVEQKMFAIMKGNFSALAVNRIREKLKNDPP
jgi:hypothetical protein